jgi:transcriptional regulator with XRE-family HTH domain
MTTTEIVSIRSSLKMTQGQLAQLLGVHSLTVSKWERGLLRPTPHQQAILRAAAAAAQRTPDVGSIVVAALIGAGVGIALFHLLQAAFDTPNVPSRPSDAPVRERQTRRR